MRSHEPVKRLSAPFGYYISEQSGYTSATYDISEYLHYGDSTNLICVCADASLEESWKF